MTSSVGNAPVAQTMGGANSNYVSGMARYGDEITRFQESASRQRASSIACVTGAAGTLGLIVATPIVAAKVGGYLAVGLTAGVSALCCLTAYCAHAEADVPLAPSDPNRQEPYALDGR